MMRFLSHNSAIARKRANVGYAILIVFICRYCWAWYYDKLPKLEWSQETSLVDSSSILSSSSQQKLKAKMQEIWNLYHSPVYIVTTDEQGYFKSFNDTISFLERNYDLNNQIKFYFLLKREFLKRYEILIVSASKVGIRPSKVSISTNLIDSFTDTITNHEEVYIHLSSALIEHAERKESEKIVKHQLVKAFPAFLIFSSAISLVTLLVYRLFKKRMVTV